MAGVGVVVDQEAESASLEPGVGITIRDLTLVTLILPPTRFPLLKGSYALKTILQARDQVFKT